MGKKKHFRESKRKTEDGGENTKEILSNASNDESAINREIAALLLNLHSSTGRQDASNVSGHAEDLSTKKVNQDSAMDLSKRAKDIIEVSPQVVVASSQNGISSSAVTVTTVSDPNFSFYPSLATMASSSISGINSSYLLQNLLIGKMHQLVGSPGTREPNETAREQCNPQNNSSGALSFPTQPLPAQALTLTSPPNLKPPASVLKSIPGANPNMSSVTSSSSSPKDSLCPTSSGQGTIPSASTSLLDNSSTKNIPLLCGQIVAQLNGLLFLVHGLSDHQVEISLQTQLGAIYTRLQELVSIVEQAKSSSHPQLSSDLPMGGSTAMSEEVPQAVSSNAPNNSNAQSNTGNLNGPKSTSNCSSVVGGLVEGGQSQVDFNASQQIQRLQPIPVSAAAAAAAQNGAEMHPEVESTSNIAAAALVAAARRRRGRPPKINDSSVVSQVEKRAKLELPTESNISQPSSSTSTIAGGKSSSAIGGTGSGGKGIRNRVFCGECIGCLKNDDCGRCRYCKDKTKFGGQNRLRQKCLHRRCQMDTHRRRPNNKSTGGGPHRNANPNSSEDQARAAAATLLAATVLKSSTFPDIQPTSPRSPSPNAIYSGVDLARLAASSVNQRELNGKSTTINEGINRTLGLTIDDDGYSPGGKNVSRIDKWKAKHEAMLKLAENQQTVQIKDDGNNVGTVHDEDEEDEEESDAKCKTSGTTEHYRSKNSEIHDIDPSEGVIINLNDQGASEPAVHQRNDVRVQEVLSV